MERHYLQENQPPGVPPLPLTGERTLPDVPEENYWFRRHLVVYEWIAERVRGKRVVDMACGEGYGSDVLAGSAASVVGVDANPEAHEHARLRYQRANLRFERDLVESFAEPCDAVVFLQTIEHVQDPGAILEHFKSMLGARRRRLRLDPQPADAGAPRGGEVGQPLAREGVPGRGVPALCEAHFAAGRDASASSTPASCARTSWRSSSAGTASTSACGLTKPFYDRFTPAIAASDFSLRKGNLDRALDFLAVCHAD